MSITLQSSPIYVQIFCICESSTKQNSRFLLGLFASAREDSKATLMANLYKALRWKCQIPGTKQIRWDSNDSKWPPWDWRILQSTPNIPRLRFNQQTLAHLRGLHWVWLHHVGDQSLGFLDRWSCIGVRLQGSSLWPVRQTLNSTAKKENLRRSYGGLQQLGVSSRVVPKRFRIPMILL